MSERNILDDIRAAGEMLPPGDRLERVYVWSMVPRHIAWKKGGRIAIHPAALAALPQLPVLRGVVPDSDRIMGAPVYYADNDRDVTRELVEYFWGDNPLPPFKDGPAHADRRDG